MWEPSETVEEEAVLEDMMEMQEGEVEEEEEEETATEVEVSEKTLKFKISTEGSVMAPGGRKSYPGSRKGSREKTQLQDCHHNVHDLVRAIHDQERDGAFRDLSQAPTITPTSPPPVSKDRPASSPSPGKHQRHGSTEDMELQGVVQTTSRKRGELCNGETKCFGDVVEQACEQLKVQASDSSLATDCALLRGENHNTPHKDKEASRARNREHSAKKTAIMKKLFSVAERLSFSSEKHSSDMTPSDSSKSSSSPLNKPDGASPTTTNTGDMRSLGDAMKKAMTLPLSKTRKPQRKSIDSEGKIGQRVLIGEGGKSYSPSSSLELLSPSENSSPEIRQQHNNKNAMSKVSQSASIAMRLPGQEVQNSNGPESSHSVLEDQDNFHHVADSSPTGGKSDLAVLSGSLDSILKGQDKSSGNNYRKKINIFSSPRSKQHFFTRLGRSNTHTEGTRPRGSEGGPSKVQQHNWMASLAASFRVRKNHHHHHQVLHKSQGQE
jgi:hypothetical protein